MESTELDLSFPRRVASATASRICRFMTIWFAPTGAFTSKVGIPVSWQIAPSQSAAWSMFCAMKAANSCGVFGATTTAPSCSNRCLIVASRTAALVCWLSAAMIAGGLLGYLALQSVQHWIPSLLGLAAASMLYVSVADLIPGLHKRPELKATLQQVVLITLGVATIWLVGELTHNHA